MPSVQLVATGENLHEKDTWTAVSKVSSSKALFKVTTEFFDTADCSGTPLVTQNVAGDNTFLNVDGTVTIDGRAADKISGSKGALGGLSSGGTVVVNGISYLGDYFVHIDTFKHLFAIDADNNIFTGIPPLDAQGYPTALPLTPSGKKQ